MADDPARLAAALADRYRIDRAIGSGGMATVYLGHDLRHQRRVAIKVLRPDLAGIIGPDRFLREIEITAGLNHPHIVPLHESGEGNGLVFFVMPYLDGESLRERLRREKQLPVDEAVSIAREVAGALSYAHARGIVHRDIKPENILLIDGQAVVADFGIAQAAAEAGGERLTETGLVVGTPAYIAPEQAAGDPDLDGRTDVYALACVLYEMLAGEPPYKGPTTQVILAGHLGHEVPHVRRLRDLVPDHIDTAITRALAKLRADRFATAREFADSLVGPGTDTPSQPRTAERPRTSPGTVRRSAGMVALAAAALLILLIGLDTGGLRDALLRRAGQSGLSEDQRSVAVLPFENVGGNPDDEYFSDGLSDELIAALSQLQSVRVAARTSAFQFKGQARDVRDIARALNVTTVLVGSVRKRADRVRVTAQLIDASSGLDLWSRTYDERALTDIFDIQADLAMRIASALEANLSSAERERIARKPTENIEAYTLYLKGRYAWDRRGQGLFTAIEYFNQAIALDSQFARAHAGVASAYPPLGVLGYIDPREGRERMREATRRAVDLDDGLAEVRTVLAAYLQVYEWDWDAAEREYKQAIAIDPDYPTAHAWYATLLWRLGRFAEAVAARQRAVELDPLAPLSALPSNLLHASRYDIAEPALREVIKLHPDFVMAHQILGGVLQATGRPEEAVLEFERAVALAGPTPEPKAQLARSLTLTGRGTEARRIVDQLRSDAAASGNYHPAMVAALIALGEDDAAIDWLEESYRQRHPALACHSGVRVWCSGQIDLDRLFGQFRRDDPRVTELLARIGFPR
ncbi:MAG: protein kinase domain-containing protein [Longimicrobiales bacterium]